MTKKQVRNVKLLLTLDEAESLIKILEDVIRENECYIALGEQLHTPISVRRRLVATKPTKIISNDKTKS
jgi:hypothetical protein